MEEEGPLPSVLLEMVRRAEAEKRLYLYDMTSPNGPIVTVSISQSR